MVGVQIPNLIMAHSEPGNSEPTKFGEYVIAKNFRSFFKFRDGEKVWTAYFSITISELGTPKLLSVEVMGSRAKHPKPLQRTYTHENLHELTDSSRGFWASKEELDEYERLAPEPESVERWQLKVVEQYRFQLLELAIRLAIDYGEPTFMKSPDGDLQRVYLERKPLTESEVKKLLKEIDKKIRQKLTPEFLGEVARIYTEAGLRGERPIKAIEEFYKCSYRTAQDYATKARTLKLLPETTPGKVTVKKATKRREKK
jgi:predicted nucleic acid-binding protein